MVYVVLVGIAKWKYEQALPDRVTAEEVILAEMTFWAGLAAIAVGPNGWSWHIVNYQQ